MISTTVFAALLSVVASSPLLQQRGTISHEKVVGFPQTVPSGLEGQLYLKYQPRLEVVNGCVPFPAVDAAGNTNEGLKPTGRSNGDCSSSVGQVYARASTFNNLYAILYSWYMPKDEPNIVEGSWGIGHRHDWEGIVVWLSGCSSSATFLGVSASAHGGWQPNKTAPTTGDSHPLIRYYTDGILDHQLGFTTKVGGSQPLIAWESLTDAARNALQTTDFGDATVPFKDSTLQGNLQAAQLK